MTNDLRLAAGDVAVGIRPDIGGAITHLDWRGHPLLRPATGHNGSVTEMACFALVPFANRIADGRFSIDGQTVALPSHPGERHALHGHGWMGNWQVMAADERSAHLSFDYPGGAWPWRYRAEQNVTLVANGAVIDVTVRNLSDHAMPVGLGLHPYLPRSASTHLDATFAGYFATDDSCLPTEWVDADDRLEVLGSGRIPVETIDNCFGGWSGRMTVAGDIVETLMETADASWVHLYAPVGASFLCVEPVTHAPDAINRPGRPDVRMLDPGQSCRFTLAITGRYSGA